MTIFPLWGGFFPLKSIGYFALCFINYLFIHLPIFLWVFLIWWGRVLRVESRPHTFKASVLPLICSLNWPWTCDLLASASQLPGLWLWTITPSLKSLSYQCVGILNSENWCLLCFSCLSVMSMIFHSMTVLNLDVVYWSLFSFQASMVTILF